MFEPDVDFEYDEPDSLGVILASAAGFGLTADEITETVLEIVDRLPADARAAYIDELTCRLAEQLLQKERSF